MKKNVIVVGAGLAGLSAALQAVKEGYHVSFISSMPSERAQSVMAEGGINAALNTKGEDDSPAQHYEDTIKAGCWLADPNAVWNMTQAAPDLVRWLHGIGVQFNTCGYDEVDLRNFGGQKKKRTAFAQSDTGKQLMTALIDAVRQKEAEGAVERFSHHFFETLLLQEGSCAGCRIRDRYSGKALQITGSAVIIASGGIHGLFGDTTGSLANTGEVTAELFRLGIPMANLEMIQFHPTTVEIGGKRMLISEAARGEGGRLFADRNGKPWYFMEEKYPELGNLMPRDITAREIWKVSQDYEVFLDMTGLSNEVFEKKLSGLVSDCQIYLHKDIRKEPVLVGPGIHYFMGGIYVDEQHRTAMEHLYAAGECCVQYHGANRLGGNSLLGALYGGRIAAQTACREAQNAEEDSCCEAEFVEEHDCCREENKAEDDCRKAETVVLQSAKRNRIHGILRKALGVVRTEESLKSALAEIRNIDGSLSLLGQAVLESALARTESRGAHWRADYPRLDDARFLKTTVASYDKTGIHISFQPIPERRTEQ